MLPFGGALTPRIRPDLTPRSAAAAASAASSACSSTVAGGAGNIEVDGGEAPDSAPAFELLKDLQGGFGSHEQQLAMHEQQLQELLESVQKLATLPTEVGQNANAEAYEA